MPAKLQGSWELVSKSGKTLNRFELVIRAHHYGFPIGLVRGEIVARATRSTSTTKISAGSPFPRASAGIAGAWRVRRFTWISSEEIRAPLARVSSTKRRIAGNR